jgi:hypothetical protein
MKTSISKPLLLILILSSSIPLYSQKFALYGTIRDSLTGENLIGAYLLIKETNQVVSANNYGFYSIASPPGNYTVICSYVGYSSYTLNIELEEDTKSDILLSPVIKSVKEVIIQGNKSSVTSTTVSKNVIPIERIKSITSISGEPDLLKSLQLLPGVQTSGEGSANINVRGGSYDQNLILLDEAPVYNPSHALGFFSVFNADALNNVSFYKGAFPSQFGGRLSSVVDITMKEGNSKKIAVNAGIGMAASKVTVEGPVIKNKASFIISGRYCYAGQTLNLLAGKVGSDLMGMYGLRNFNDNNDIRFYDLNAKINFRVNDKNRIYFSTYLGRDRFYSYSLNNDNDLDWGNITSTLRWNHLFSSSVFSNFTAYFSNYNYSYYVNDDLKNFTWKSNIKEAGIKSDFIAYPGASNTIKFGFASKYHYFEPGTIEPRSDKSSIKASSLGRKNAFELSAYLGNEQKFSDHLNMEYGLRYVGFINIGPDTVFYYNRDKSEITGFKSYNTLEVVQFRQSLEPRISFRYLFNEQNSVKLAYGYTTQFLHLLSNSSLGLPTDVWMPPDKYIPPQSSHQAVLGYYHLFGRNKYELTTELYYKTLRNIIDYKDNANLFMNKHIETQVLKGNGYAYGAEFMLERKIGALTGWISYTWSKTQYKINGINENEYFSPRWDIRHNLSITGSYLINPKWLLSSTFKYTSGGFITIPEGSYVYNGAAFNYYTQRNGYQLEPYHRLDLTLIYKSPKNRNRNLKSEWVFSIYNVYNRKNIYALFVHQEGYLLTSSRFYRMYLMGIVPTITYNIKF